MRTIPPPVTIGLNGPPVANKFSFVQRKRSPVASPSKLDWKAEDYRAFDVAGHSGRFPVKAPGCAEVPAKSSAALRTTSNCTRPGSSSFQSAVRANGWRIFESFIEFSLIVHQALTVDQLQRFSLLRPQRRRDHRRHNLIADTESRRTSARMAIRFSLNFDPIDEAASRPATVTAPVP
jgi:hypothetical protein